MTDSETRGEPPLTEEELRALRPSRAAGSSVGITLGGAGVAVLFVLRCVRFAGATHDMLETDAPDREWLQAQQRQSADEQLQLLRRLADNSAAAAPTSAQRMHDARAKWFRLRSASGAWRVVNLNGDACPAPTKDNACLVDVLGAPRSLTTGRAFAAAAKEGNVLVAGEISLEGTERRLHVREAYINAWPVAVPGTSPFFDSGACQLHTLWRGSAFEPQGNFRTTSITDMNDGALLTFGALSLKARGVIATAERSRPNETRPGAIACLSEFRSLAGVHGVFEKVFPLPKERE